MRCALPWKDGTPAEELQGTSDGEHESLPRNFCERKDKPLRIGLIGAGKFARDVPRAGAEDAGVQLVGIADLSPANARENLARVGGLERLGASLDAPGARRMSRGLADAGRASGDRHHHRGDRQSDRRGRAHALAAFRNGKHVVMVTVEADAFCGPLLAQKAAEAGVVYSLAYGDQPALICDLVDWARAAGFPGRGGRARPQVAAALRAIDARDRVGLLRPDAGAGEARRPEPEDVQFVPRRLEAGDRDHRGVQRHRPDAGARRACLSAGVGGRDSRR